MKIIIMILTAMLLLSMCSMDIFGITVVGECFTNFILLYEHRNNNGNKFIRMRIERGEKIEILFCIYLIWSTMIPPKYILLWSSMAFHPYEIKQ